MDSQTALSSDAQLVRIQLELFAAISSSVGYRYVGPRNHPNCAWLRASDPLRLDEEECHSRDRWDKLGV
jgi:hypothetical protein